MGQRCSSRRTAHRAEASIFVILPYIPPSSHQSRSFSSPGMPTATRVRLKVCCISSIDEARMAVAAGADAVGLVSAMPSGPGPIEEPLIARIVATVPPPVATFLLTSLQRADDIVAQQRRCGANTLQLVDAVPFDDLRRLRDALPGVRLVQVIHVTGAASVDEAVAVAPLVDAILLDSGNPALAVKELGGTGRTHDWAVSARIREALSLPLFLAGGLDAANVAEAIRAVRPFGVDVCSRIRVDGRLDAAKLGAFVAAVAAA
jgi:phosphoribosylanthranilate isomerase